MAEENRLLDPNLDFLYFSASYCLRIRVGDVRCSVGPGINRSYHVQWRDLAAVLRILARMSTNVIKHITF